MNHSKSQNPWIAGLSSFVVHLLILLLMAVISLTGSGTGEKISIESGQSDNSPEQLEALVLEAQQNDEPSPPSPASVFSEQLSSTPLIANTQPTLEIALGDQPQVAEVVSEVIRHASGNETGSAPSFIASSLEGRSAKNRMTIGQSNGATPPSEAAVEAALAYLARHQRPNGSWTMIYENGPCQGACDHSAEGLDPHEIAATGLALLCFLGAGNTMQEGEYSENVNKGVYFLVQNIKSRQTGQSTWLSMVNHDEMYEHGIATLALCEALQMKGDSELLTKPCQEAVNFIVHAQHAGGGWAYHPRSGPGDLSIVGWQVMALKSAVGAKLAVNAGTIRNVDAFLNQHVQGGFLFNYNQREKPSASMTAIGTLMRLYRGWFKTDPAIIKAIEYLGKQGPSEMDLYYDYYATQVMFQYGGKPWKTWNERMREYLIYTQEKEGHMAGSWWFPGKRDDPLNVAANRSGVVNRAGGRFYVTTMACLILEVYYRYLPVNNEVSQEFRF